MFLYKPSLIINEDVEVKKKKKRKRERERERESSEVYILIYQGLHTLLR